MEDNQAYGTTTTCAGVRLLKIPTSQNTELTHNQAYVTTRNIPVTSNECYGSTTSPLDHVYASVEESLQQQDWRENLSDYDYVTSETVLQKLD
jgi:hypothetical protein